MNSSEEVPSRRNSEMSANIIYPFWLGARKGARTQSGVESLDVTKGSAVAKNAWGHVVILKVCLNAGI